MQYFSPLASKLRGERVVMKKICVFCSFFVLLRAKNDKKFVLLVAGSVFFNMQKNARLLNLYV